jgi:hypothetical protein
MYNPSTDFLSLLRNTGSGKSVLNMPGLDWTVAALARAGLINLSVGQTAPMVNQPTTAWFKPSQPSWVAEGVLYLWNASAAQYQVATPSLWQAALSGTNSYAFQSAKSASNLVNAGTTLLAIQRAGPSATTLILPPLNQRIAGQLLKVVDWSTAVVNHAVTITTTDGSSIMQETSWGLLSTAVQLAGIGLYPSPDLNGWVIAP